MGILTFWRGTDRTYRTDRIMNHDGVAGSPRGAQGVIEITSPVATGGGRVFCPLTGQGVNHYTVLCEDYGAAIHFGVCVCLLFKVHFIVHAHCSVFYFD